MKELVNFNGELEFRNNIFEISSISLESEYEVCPDKISGVFLVSGSYRGHEISLNQETFNKKLPFEYSFKDKMIEDTVSLEVKDFTYEIDQNKVSINIEYEIKGEKMIFEDEREFDKFLEDHEVEVVDLTDEKDDENEKIEEKIEEPVEEEKEDKTIEEEKEEVRSIPEEKEEERKKTNDSEIIDTLKDGENTYITYHIHVCDESDTLEYLANKYKISIDIIKDYNSIDNISAGMKLIIPCQDE